MFDNTREFRYSYSGSTAGHYKRSETSEFAIHRRRRGPKRQSGPGTICPACGIERSRMNKCECNS